MTAALVLRGLTKRYADLAAVDGLDLTVEAGTLYGFLGPNGAGKTTTIRMLLGLVHPTGGTMEVLGAPIGAAQLRRIGALVEEPAFWRYLSGGRNLEYFARAAGPSGDRRDRLGRVDEVLGQVGLADAGGKKVKAYSQGMRQRLGIARALLGRPDVLVLDEPTNGLDPQGMREVRLLLRRLADGGTTVFVSSHLLGEVESMCDRVGVLARGRLVAEGSPAQLRGSGDRLRIDVDDPAGARRLLGGMAGLALGADGDGARTGAGAGAGTLRVHLAAPATAAAVNAALVAGGVAVSALVPERERLEDVFLELTGPEP